MTKAIASKSYRADLAEYVCACFADGQSLAHIFRKQEHKHPFTEKEIKGFPKDIRTHYRWIKNVPDYKEMIRYAQEDRADNYVDQMVDVADAAIAGTISVNAARLKIDTIKWVACKLKPKAYSDDAVRNLGKTDEKLQVQFNFVLGDEEKEKKVKQIEATVRSSDQLLEDDAREAELLFQTEEENG